MPIKVMKAELVAIPIITQSTPIKVNGKDNAEANSFNIHKNGAGHFNLMKIKILIRAAKQPKTVVRIKMMSFVISIGVCLVQFSLSTSYW